MTRMLASVANAAEAGVVVQLGADIVDLRDARQGALGAVSLETAREAIAAIAGRSKRARRSAIRPTSKKLCWKPRERWRRWASITSSSPSMRLRSTVSAML